MRITAGKSRTSLLAAASLAAAVAIMSLCLSSCAALQRAAMEKLSQIRIYDFKMESFKPSGLRAADLTFSVKIYNPTVKLELKDIAISVTYKDKEIAIVSPEPVILPRRSESEHHIATRLELAPKASLMDLAALAAGGFDKDDIILGITATGIGSNVIVKKIDETMSLRELERAASSTSGQAN